MSFRPNGAQHISLGQVKPRMRMNAAPGHRYETMDIALKGQRKLIPNATGINPRHNLSSISITGVVNQMDQVFHKGS